MVDPQAGKAWGSTHPPHSLRDEEFVTASLEGGHQDSRFKALVQPRVVHAHRDSDHTWHIILEHDTTRGIKLLVRGRGRGRGSYK